MARFSKQALAQHLVGQLRPLLIEWGFDHAEGWAQVAPIAKDRMRTNPIKGCDDPSYCEAMAYMAYGEFSKLWDLADEFELDLSGVLDGLTKTHTKARPRTPRYRPVGSI